MKINRAAVSAFILLLFAAEAAFPSDQEVVRFQKSRFSLGAVVDYNYLLFEQASEEPFFYANKPLDIGLILGISGFKLKFSFAVPVWYQETPNNDNFSMDFMLDHYGTYHYFNGYFRYNSDFLRNDDHSVDMEILKIGLSQHFTFNRAHSLRSVYTLDRRQTESNGSFVIGLGIYYSSIVSNEIKYEHQYHLYFGQDFGYSYIWVIKENFFINVLQVFGVNMIISLGDGFSFLNSVSFGFEALPKIAVGYHGKNWSWNIHLHGSYLYAFPGTDKMMNLFSGNVGTSFILRFY